MNYIEEIYQQYLNDPQAVDLSWQRYFASLSMPPFASLGSSVLKEENYLEAYRRYGHLNATIDPLHLWGTPRPADPRLPISSQTEKWRAIYCGNIGFEYQHINSDIECRWLQDRIETITDPLYDAETKKNILDQLVASETLEKYLDSRYVGQKRFSIEGADSLIPMLDALVQRAPHYGLKEIMIGMAHRGRLNVLVNVMGYSPALLFAEFEHKAPEHTTSGDVKYHKGCTRGLPDLQLSLAFNPSHLEFINPVIVGAVRAYQDRYAPADRFKSAMPVQIHGDAAFAGQGIVMETLGMSQTRAYSVGGSLHIVINNQVGFTTSCVEDARSSQYCTDVAKMLDVPIFHVNGDDAEACVRVLQLALDYRMMFFKDVVIDLVCYRRYGHQEVDEPMATQPLMYQAIKKHPTTMALYAEKLVKENVCTQSMLGERISAYRQKLESGEPVVAMIDVPSPPFNAATHDTINNQKLKTLAAKIVQYPADFQLQRQVNTLMEARKKMAVGEQPLDWGFAEILAYATLLDAGYPVRLSGEDCRRGTFYHRHAVLHDQNTGREHMPLAEIGPVQIYDSLLSEAGAMGFEYGYSTIETRGLTLWEAQYGDFANGAQVIIDQFISCGCQKWEQYSGLTLLLPHGYEGDGPEHSSARLERFLQLCAENNMQVCVPTTPAQIYHLLRRQALSWVAAEERRPLIIMSPKGLLRHKLATSSFDELSQGSFEDLIINAGDAAREEVTRIILCSGKVYYDVLEARQERHLLGVALIRVEQLYPFPSTLLKKALASYKKAKTVVWCQHEPQNQGAWSTVYHDIKTCLRADQKLWYAGRDASAAPSTGYPARHKQQQLALIEAAFSEFSEKNEHDCNNAFRN